MTPDNVWAKLEGQTIRQLHVYADELYFTLDSGVLRAVMDSDCCSESWVGDVVNVPALLGATVCEVKPVTLEDAGLPLRVWDDSRTRQSDDQYFGFTLETDKGTCSVVARNSSNGYYGGNFCELQEAELPKLARELTEDYSA